MGGQRENKQISHVIDRNEESAVSYTDWLWNSSCGNTETSSVLWHIQPRTEEWITSKMKYIHALNSIHGFLIQGKRCQQNMCSLLFTGSYVPSFCAWRFFNMCLLRTAFPELFWNSHGTCDASASIDSQRGSWWDSQGGSLILIPLGYRRKLIKGKNAMTSVREDLGSSRLHCGMFAGANNTQLWRTQCEIHRPIPSHLFPIHLSTEPSSKQPGVLADKWVTKQREGR